MRSVIQRVKRASVAIDGKVKSVIGEGLLVLVGVENADTQEDIDYLCGKIAMLRIFNDEAGVMNCSMLDVGGEVLIVSQFTLFAGTRKGNRPSYIRASKGDFAKDMYEKFCKTMQEKIGKAVGTGEFGADMKVELLNDGPVTIIIDSKERDF
jgi:D-tyrosyl-tRNA(Tyr) deacylase